MVFVFILFVPVCMFAGILHVCLQEYCMYVCRNTAISWGDEIRELNGGDVQDLSVDLLQRKLVSTQL